MILYKKYCKTPEGVDAITISRGELATIAGTAKESLIRTLGDFRNENLIEIKEDGSILILDDMRLKLMLN
jgi:CRP-like cAMP-binding protein